MSESTKEKNATAENWLYYTHWLEQKLPYYFSLLNPGASSAEIAQLESYFGFALPEQLKKLYETNNGEKQVDKGPDGTFLGFHFFSIDEVIKEHTAWMTHTLDIPGTSFPDGAITLHYFNPKWIPIFTDSAGNDIGIDMDPGPTGAIGQVINFGRDEDNKFVIAKDLDALLLYVRDQIENGTCDTSITKEDDSGYSYGLAPQSHLIDDLRSVFGKKS